MPHPFKQMSTWQETAKQMQDHREETLAAIEPNLPDLPSELPLNVTPLAKELLTEREMELTESPPEDLLAVMRHGLVTSTEVTEAFLRRAALAQKLTNCVTELLPERALERAKYLDSYYSKHKKPVGPLHGLPISVKEHIGMKDLDCNAGFVSWVGKNNMSRNALILQILQDAGAVLYVRTTQPQSLMHLETSSNLYGETVNPFNRKLTAGGSSGGEGALVGFKGSCLGIGTDIGGSIRSPAANCGVFGLRPTSYRLPNEGCMATMLSQEHIVPVIGPLSTSLEGVKVFTKTLIDAKPWLHQPSLLPFEWKEGDLLGTGKTKLKVAVLWDDGIVLPHPPIARALKGMVEQLKSVEGIEIVEWKPYKHDLAWEIIASLYFADGASEEKYAIAESGEPFRPLTNFIITDNPYVKAHSIADMWDWTAKRDKYRAEYAELWNSTATGSDEEGNLVGMVDIILCPVGPGAAPPLNCARYWGYTSQWNLLDYPALVFPVSSVNPEVDGRDGGYQPRNEKDKYNHELYEPETYRDAPISLQLVGRRYDDEKIIQALEFISKSIKLPLPK